MENKVIIIFKTLVQVELCRVEEVIFLRRQIDIFPSFYSHVKCNKSCATHSKVTFSSELKSLQNYDICTLPIEIFILIIIKIITFMII